jgi:hypothetical protein
MELRSQMAGIEVDGTSGRLRQSWGPVEAGFVIHPEDYPYSSARDYFEEKGYLDVVLIE